MSSPTSDVVDKKHVKHFQVEDHLLLHGAGNKEQLIFTECHFGSASLLSTVVY